MTALDALRPRTSSPGSPVPRDGDPGHRGLPAVLAWLCGAVVAARLCFIWQPLRADEGGYLYAARHWDPGQPFLYGDFHVDRPPLLLWIYRIAALSDWDGLIRVLAIPFALLAVLATARAGYRLAGRRGACWSAALIAALGTSPALAADQADGEVFAYPLVAASVACTLEAWARTRTETRLAFAAAAGGLGAAAVLVKQNFLEGLLFAAALVVLDCLRRRRMNPRARQVAVAGSLGALVPAALLLTWMHTTGQPVQRLWDDLIIFRGDAFAVIVDGSMGAPLRRAAQLLVLAAISAMPPLAYAWTAARRRRGPGRPEHTAITLCLAYGALAIVAGGSYWPHYLLQVVPLLALAAGTLAADCTRAAARTRRWCRAAAASAVAAVMVSGIVYATVPSVWSHQRSGEWLAGSADPGDTALVAYGSPSVLEAADLPTPYPYLWSLQMRTLDPDQARLRALLAGPHAPTWLVERNHWNSWRIDDTRRLRDLIRSRYDVVATVCGAPVWLRSDQARDLAPLPRCSGSSATGGA